MLPLVLLVGIVHSIWRFVGIICRHRDLGEQSLISKMTFKKVLDRETCDRFCAKFNVKNLTSPTDPCLPSNIHQNVKRTMKNICYKPLGGQKKAK